MKYEKVGPNRYEIVETLDRTETAALLGTSREAVRQIEERALTKFARGLIETCERLTADEVRRAVARIVHHAKNQDAKNAWARDERAA